MRKVLQFILDFIVTRFGGKYAGKWIGFFDYCRRTVCRNLKTFAGQIHRRMELDNIIPAQKDDEEAIGIEATTKTKVRIIYPAGCSWNNIHTLYESFAGDQQFQTYVVVENYPRFIDIMKKVGCKYIPLDKYDIREDRPDILVATYYSYSDPTINFPGVHDYVKLIIAAIPNVVMNEKNNDVHWHFIHHAYEHLDPDYYLCERPVYNSLKEYVDAGKLLELGNPQYDEIFREVGKAHPKPDSWKKLEGKTVFLWATDHGINESYPTNGFTVDLYLGKMLKYFSEHQEIGLIFRPHPEFVREMLSKGHFWSPAELQQVKDYCAKTGNVVWDDTYDYCCAFDTCHAFIVDLNCSIACAALTTGKPICRLHRDDIDEWVISPELSQCYYYARNFDECLRYIDMIKEGKDEIKETRLSTIPQAILHFDGQNGQRMKDCIVDCFNRQDKHGDR